MRAEGCKYSNEMQNTILVRFDEAELFSGLNIYTNDVCDVSQFQKPPKLPNRASWTRCSRLPDWGNAR